MDKKINGAKGGDNRKTANRLCQRQETNRTINWLLVEFLLDYFN
jgi:hypothetical protein